VPKVSFLVRPESGQGVRLDVFLARQVPDFTRSQFQRFVDKGLVKVNGEDRKSGVKLRAGDRVEADIDIPEPAPAKAEPKESAEEGRKLKALELVVETVEALFDERDNRHEVPRPLNAALAFGS